MLKKIIPIALSFCLLFSITVTAVNQDTEGTEETPATSQPMPRERRGNMGTPPEGWNRGERPSGEFTPPQGDFTPSQGCFTPPQGEFTPPQGDFTPPKRNSTSSQGEFTPPQKETTPSQPTPAPQENNTPETMPQKEGETQTESPQTPNGAPQFNGQMPGGMGDFSVNRQNFNQNTQPAQEQGFWGFVKTNTTPITSVILLALAFIFVIFYRRKNY